MEEGGEERKAQEVNGGACACSKREVGGVAVGRLRKEKSLLLEEVDTTDSRYCLQLSCKGVTETKFGFGGEM